MESKWSDHKLGYSEKEEEDNNSEKKSSSSPTPLSDTKNTENNYAKQLLKGEKSATGRAGAMAFQRKTSGNAAKLDGNSSSSSSSFKGSLVGQLSPTDSMLSPCTKKLRRKQSKKISSFDTVSLDFWVPPEEIEIILGSSSASRAQILVELGWDFKIVTPDLNEDLIECSDPFRLPVLLAKEKAKKIIEKLGNDLHHPSVIITCDQIVLFHNEVRNKPLTRQQAKEFLLSYQNHEIIQTISAVVATHYPSGKQASEIDLSTIYWTGIPEEVIDNILLEKDGIYSSCGGILIEDPDFLAYVDHIDGDLDSIRGLPIKATKKVFRTVISTDI